VRNPYYFKVDPEGNQLPYIDRLTGIKIQDQEVNLLKVLNGELDLGGWGLGVSDFPTLKKNEDQGNYRAWIAEDLWGAATVYCINQTYVGEGADIINPYLQNVKFRQALSVAINRNEINELVGLGQGTPRQATVHPKTIGFEQEWADSYAQYDPDLANSLLDEIGLTSRNAEGFRMDPDGNVITLDIPLRASHTYWVEMTELVRNYWQDVGIKVNVRNVGKNLGPLLNSSTYQVFAWALDRVFGPAFIESNGSWLNPSFWFGPVGPLWKNWLVSDGESGEEPPQIIKDLYEGCQNIQYVPPEQQREIVKLIGEAYAENIWMIGTVGMIGKPVIVSKGLGNVRDDFYAEGISVPNNQWTFQYYWTDEGRRSEG
jgi:peptide/nickel transport system substrate-binding protein